MFRPKLNLVVLDPGSGRARPGAWVSIYSANTLSLAALYADDDVTELANPIQANQLGQVVCRVNPGFYDIAMTWDGGVPTVVEDVLAWTPEQTVITTKGDLIVGDATGTPARLAVGESSQVLVVVDGVPTWSRLGGNVGLPHGDRGALLMYDPNEWLTVRTPGTEGQMLAMLGGIPTWATHLPDPPGSLLPISEVGDLVAGSALGTPMKLARGADGQILSTDPDGSGLLRWIDPPVPPDPGGGDMDNPMLALGDLIIGVDAAGAPGRLPIGASGTVLTVVGGLPTWTPLPVRRVVEVYLPLEGARMPDGSANNAVPTPLEYVSTGVQTPNTVKVVAFAFSFLPLLQQALLWKIAIPAAYTGGIVTAVVKWRAPGITGQMRIRAAVGPVTDASDPTTAVFNPPTISAPTNLPATANQLQTLRMPLDQLANVLAGRMCHVMIGVIESGADPGAVIVEQAWLEFTLDT